MTQNNLSMKQTHRHRKQIVVVKCMGAWGGMDWEIGISRYKLSYIEWVNNKV